VTLHVARALLTRRAMKAWLATALVVSLIGCTDSGPPEGEDFDDPDAKADGVSQPLGVYHLMNSDSFDDEPRIDVLDIRSDGTYYEEEQAPVDAGDGNIETGWSETFGTFKFTKDRYGNRYIRFKEGFQPDNSWRWKFKTHGTGTAQIDFIYATNEIGFSLKRDVRPTATFVKHVKDGYSTASRTKIADPTPSHWTGELPDSLAARVRDLQLSDEDHSDLIKASSIKVDNVKVFILEWGVPDNQQVEIFAHDSQLLAKTKTVAPLLWSDLTP
jgi:hypothetical protein